MHNFLISQLKHEVERKSLDVATYLLVESACGDAVESSQVGIEHNFVTTNEQDALT